jgi:hypothetical protein
MQNSISRATLDSLIPLAFSVVHLSIVVKRDCKKHLLCKYPVYPKPRWFRGLNVFSILIFRQMPAIFVFGQMNDSEKMHGQGYHTSLQDGESHRMPAGWGFLVFHAVFRKQINLIIS